MSPSRRGGRDPAFPASWSLLQKIVCAVMMVLLALAAFFVAVVLVACCAWAVGLIAGA